MARQRISLVPDEVKKQETLESRILSGEINASNFAELSPEDQKQVNQILFKMASEKVDPNVGVSSLEFLIFAFMRIANKKLNGIPLNSEDLIIQESLNQILEMHEITNDNISKENWLFDYMAYAVANAEQILENRKEHIQRKQQVTGKV